MCMCVCGSSAQVPHQLISKAFQPDVEIGKEENIYTITHT